jgi:hypothetical protein
MHDREYRLSRRKFLAQAAALTVSGGVPANASVKDPVSSAGTRTRPAKLSTQGRKPIAVVCTVYRSMSHAYHIAGRFIHGYFRNGRFHTPGQFVSAMYVDQFPTNDLGREIARDFDIRLAPSVADALLDPSGKLAVDGVLLIGEHGNYPRNDKGQILYPRYEMMEQIVSVFRRTGQTVPVFNDKHLSYRWDRSKQMYDWSQELRFPFMAGSSLPVTWRRPELELPLDVGIEDALVAAFGPIEVYGFHALETLQVMIERRKGGETGVKAVTCLTGKDVWKAGDAGQWSWDLLENALSRSETLNPGDIRSNVGLPVQSRPATPAIAFLVEYRDGLRGTVLLLNGHIQDFCFAAKLKGDPKPASCMFYLPMPPGAKFFDCLVPPIEALFETKKSLYPVERTLLTSGTLEAAMESHYRRGLRVETPELTVAYSAPADSSFNRGSVASASTGE